MFIFQSSGQVAKQQDNMPAAPAGQAKEATPASANAAQGGAKKEAVPTDSPNANLKIAPKPTFNFTEQGIRRTLNKFRSDVSEQHYDLEISATKKEINILIFGLGNTEFSEDCADLLSGLMGAQPELFTESHRDALFLGLKNDASAEGCAQVIEHIPPNLFKAERLDELIAGLGNPASVKSCAHALGMLISPFDSQVESLLDAFNDERVVALMQKLANMTAWVRAGYAQGEVFSLLAEIAQKSDAGRKCIISNFALINGSLESADRISGNGGKFALLFTLDMNGFSEAGQIAAKIAGTSPENFEYFAMDVHFSKAYGYFSKNFGKYKPAVKKYSKRQGAATLLARAYEATDSPEIFRFIQQRMLSTPQLVADSRYIFDTSRSAKLRDEWFARGIDAYLSRDENGLKQKDSDDILQRLKEFMATDSSKLKFAIDFGDEALAELAIGCMKDSWGRIRADASYPAIINEVYERAIGGDIRITQKSRLKCCARGYSAPWNCSSPILASFLRSLKERRGRIMQGLQQPPSRNSTGRLTNRRSNTLTKNTRKGT